MVNEPSAFAKPLFSPTKDIMWKNSHCCNVAISLACTASCTAVLIIQFSFYFLCFVAQGPFGHVPVQSVSFALSLSVMNERFSKIS